GPRPGSEVRLQALQHAAARERRVAEHHARRDHRVAGDERAAPPRVRLEREIDARAAPRIGAAELPAEAGAPRPAREQIERRPRRSAARRVVARRSGVAERVVAAAPAADEGEGAGAHTDALARDLEVERAGERALAVVERQVHAPEVAARPLWVGARL